MFLCDKDSQYDLYKMCASLCPWSDLMCAQMYKSNMRTSVWCDFQRDRWPWAARGCCPEIAVFCCSSIAESEVDRWTHTIPIIWLGLRPKRRHGRSLLHCFLGIEFFVVLPVELCQERAVKYNRVTIRDDSEERDVCKWKHDIQGKSVMQQQRVYRNLGDWRRFPTLSINLWALKEQCLCPGESLW